MGLQAIAVVLFTLCFSQALTWMCFNCPKVDASGNCAQTANCPSSSYCGSTITHNFTNVYGSKYCADSSCINWSLNLGFYEMTSQCCASDYCNEATDSTNGVSCATCSDLTCSSTTTLQCKGDETQCISIKVFPQNATNFAFLGCASTSICDGFTLIETPLNPFLPLDYKIVFSCNGGESLTQGVMLLVPTLSLLFSV